MNDEEKKTIKERITELEKEAMEKQKTMQQAQGVVQQTQVDLIGLQGALFELKKLVEKKKKA